MIKFIGKNKLNHIISMVTSYKHKGTYNHIISMITSYKQIGTYSHKYIQVYRQHIEGS